jgi:hypothetical protein
MQSHTRLVVRNDGSEKNRAPIDRNTHGAHANPAQQAHGPTMLPGKAQKLLSFSVGMH